MENDASMNHEEKTDSTITIKGILSLLMESVDGNGADKRLISMGMGDPSIYTCFHTTDVAQEAVLDTLQSQKFNGYAPTVGLLQTRRAIAEYLSRDLPYELTSDDVFITSGCTQAIDVSVAMLAHPGANILIPRPGFPIYDLCAAFRQVEVRHYDLLPEKGWEVDLEAVESLADKNTIALVIINPGNPCGNVYSYHHLKKIAETAKKLGTVVIADEVYGHLAFGANPFVTMGVFGSDVPIITLGSLLHLGPYLSDGLFLHGDLVVERIKKYFDILGGPATFIQAAVPRIITETEEAFFRKTLNMLRHTSDVCCKEIEDIPCIFCPHKPDGSIAMMVKLNLSLLDDISDDIDFCFKLAKEESVIILPGTAVGLKDWLRITFAVDPSALEEAMERIKSFYRRHARKWRKQQQDIQLKINYS